jgi:hypothetical protein
MKMEEEHKSIMCSRTKEQTELVCGFKFSQTGHKTGNYDSQDPERDNMEYTVST